MVCPKIWILGFLRIFIDVVNWPLPNFTLRFDVSMGGFAISPNNFLVMTNSQTPPLRTPMPVIPLQATYKASFKASPLKSCPIMLTIVFTSFLWSSIMVVILFVLFGICRGWGWCGNNLWNEWYCTQWGSHIEFVNEQRFLGSQLILSRLWDVLA